MKMTTKAEQNQERLCWTRPVKVRALGAALLFAAISASLSWPGVSRGGPGDADESENLRIAYNLAQHGIFHDAPDWSPDAGPFMHREPGHPVFIALVLATVPSFPEVPPGCVLDPQCAPGKPLRDRYRQAELAMVAIAVGATFLAALALTRSWKLALASGIVALSMINYNTAGNAFVGVLLLAHAVLAWRVWKRPRDGHKATAALAGLALGLAVLTEAVLQYWLLVLAVLCAVGLWREAGRRRPLAVAVAVMLLVASLPAGLWMARNHIVAGQFTISGRQGEILTIRAEYTQATWPEVGGMLAFWAPRGHFWGSSILRRFAMDWLHPETFGYARIKDTTLDVSHNLAGFYPRAKYAMGSNAVHMSHSEVARRADLLVPGWREGAMHERDLALRQASLQLIRENWLKHLVISGPMALRGMDQSCRKYVGLRDRSIFIVPYALTWIACQVSETLSLAFFPAALVMLFLAARRRDVALTLLVLPAVYFFSVHALATHFIPRWTQPIMPLLIVVAALAAQEYSRRRAARTDSSPETGGGGPHPPPRPSSALADS